jgi:hypothetical protein
MACGHCLERAAGKISQSTAHIAVKHYIKRRAVSAVIISARKMLAVRGRDLDLLVGLGYKCRDELI